jgi:hypothetical protein
LRSPSKTENNHKGNNKKQKKDEVIFSHDSHTDHMPENSDSEMGDPTDYNMVQNSNTSNQEEEIIDIYHNLLLSGGVCIHRSENLYVLQDIDTKTMQLSHTEFVHIMKTVDTFSCDCEYAQHRHKYECIHQLIMSERFDTLDIRPLNTDNILISSITGTYV